MSQEGADKMTFLDEAGDELELEFFALEKSVGAEIVIVRMADDDHPRNIVRHPVQDVNFVSPSEVHSIFRFWKRGRCGSRNRTCKQNHAEESSG
ncbi:hypothetical protein V6N13_121377 [Hibiscus sabdariffa]|uniref:Uncharacterized protein n=1 Tax=Hibiscus sabdariffa TaxID=183260 RepID=A0ABR2PDZ5_9ROSI